MRIRLLWTACLLAAATSLPIAAAEKKDADEEAWIAAHEAGATAGFKAYLKEFPKGRHAAAARVKLAILADPNGTPPAIPAGTAATASTKPATPKVAVTSRPHLPFELSEEVWSAIEKSGLASTALPRKTVEVAYTESSDSDFAKLHVQTTQSVNKRISPLSDAQGGYQETELRQEISWTNSNGGRGAPQASSSRSYSLAAVLPLGTVDGNGKLVARLSRIHELQGSLFPLRIGAEVSVRYDNEYAPNHAYDSTVSSKCRIIAKVAAATLNPQLPGDAWQMSCQTTMLMNGKTIENSGDQHFVVADWAVTNQQLGVLDLTKKSQVIPNGRYQYQFLKSAYTIDGYRITARD